MSMTAAMTVAHWHINAAIAENEKKSHQIIRNTNNNKDDNDSNSDKNDDANVNR